MEVNVQSNTSSVDRSFAPSGLELGSGLSKTERRLSVVVAATFTADPVSRPLQYWMQSLGIAADIEMAPYAQVLQELLNPHSLLCRPTNSFNIVLLRLEDWFRESLAPENAGGNVGHLRKVTGELAEAFRTARKWTRTPMLVLFAPPSSSLPEVYVSALEQTQGELRDQLRKVPDVHCWAHQDVIDLYPVEVHEDASSDRMGHIPFTREYFVAMASLVARRIAVSVKPPHKVIAVDCDNTLWKGVCGEDGLSGIELTPAHLAFQQLLVDQHDAGMLICLCSKNNEDDVREVFAKHPQMRLREEHLVALAVNWESKASNLERLAKELDLALDSFIFIDDSPVECAEVRSRCPSVLALQFPQPPDVAHFLKHVWAFDRIGTSDNARRRTAQYKENRLRSLARAQTTDISTFLASLELKVVVAPMLADQLSRVAELVQRTNQFNLTTIRRRASEIDQLCRDERVHVLVTHVSDRFGDYGLVGAVIYRLDAKSVDVDTFVLSCRALGRGAEHLIVNALGRIALEAGIPYVLLRYRQTERSAPARKFLIESFAQYQLPSSETAGSVADTIFRVPADYAAHVTVAASAALPEEVQESSAPASRNAGEFANDWHDVAWRLSRVEDVVREMGAVSGQKCSDAIDYVEPRTPVEKAIAKIWAEVLGSERIGLHDDFFDLGGDSIVAVQALSRIESTLGRELSLHELFEGPTVEQLAARLEGAAQSGSSIERAARVGPVPLSYAQQRLWFIDQLEGGSTAYHLPLVLTLLGNLDEVALQAALNQLMARHEALRTVFIKVDGEPLQHVLSDARLPLRGSNLSLTPAQAREAKLQESMRDEVVAPFNLATGPLIRARLLKLHEQHHVLLITMHHIVSDGWSLAVLKQELGILYEASRNGRHDPLPALPVRYVDYAEWQRQHLGQSDQIKQVEYWVKHLEGAPEILELPSDKPRPVGMSYRGASVPVVLSAGFTTQLKALSRKLDLTLFMTLYTAWSILLARLSGQHDIVVGVPVANRRRTELEGLVGFFVNTLAVRVRLEDDPTIVDVMQTVKRSLLQAYEHQDVPFEKVVETVRPTRSLSHSAIFQVMFVLQNAAKAGDPVSGLVLREEMPPVFTAQFDLTLSLQESGDQISGYIKYASDLFERETIERWAGYFEAVLAAAVQDPGCKLSAVQIMGEAERRRILHSFNETRVDYPRNKLIHELFEEQAHRTPNSIAVSYAEQKLTYAELNAKADQLARYLKRKGVGPDRLVAIFFDRSVHMLVGLLGTLKAGGAYVPLDPTNPADRLQHVLTDAAPLLVLTSGRLQKLLPPTPATVVAMDRDWAQIADTVHDDSSMSLLRPDSERLAYVIYTSGSTGKPKGVMISHRNIVNYAIHAARQFDVASGDGSLISTSISFDLMLTGLYPTLICGRTVRLCPETHSIPELEAELRGCRNLSPLKLTPSHLALLESALTSGRLNGRVRVLVLGGETLPANVVRMWRDHAPDTRIFNHYGPTEATVGCVVNEVVELPVSGAVPIGRPISNVRIYILDRQMRPVPIGVVGEIHVAGEGVARGYLNLPNLTAERFVSDPFSDDPTSRLYKTGDMGRWRADGVVECLGRNDHQVKIRGHRIELGEIEAQLMEHPLVREAVVMPRDGKSGDTSLVAYVVANDYPNGDSFSPSDALRTHLAARLPVYMIPSAFARVDRLPLTSNGKLDRRALSAMEITASSSVQHDPPRGSIEEVLAQIWMDLLALERVGRGEDFFALGGHSLLVTRVISRVRERLHVELPMRALFEAPTIQQLATVIETSRRELAANESDPDADLEDLRREIEQMEPSAVMARIAELEQELRSPRA